MTEIDPKVDEQAVLREQERRVTYAMADTGLAFTFARSAAREPLWNVAFESPQTSIQMTIQHGRLRIVADPRSTTKAAQYPALLKLNTQLIDVRVALGDERILATTEMPVERASAEEIVKLFGAVLRAVVEINNVSAGRPVGTGIDVPPPAAKPRLARSKRH